MPEQSPDTFEVKLRVLGNEVLGMEISSQSKARNWAAFGLVALIVISLVAAQVAPLFSGLFG